MEIKDFTDSLAQKVKKGIGISINEGFEWVRRLKARNKATREAHKRKEFPTYNTHVDGEMPDQMGQQKYLVYALSFIRKEEPLYYHILVLRMRGLSLKQLSEHLNLKGFNTTVSQLSKKEAEAIRYVGQKIEHIRKTGIPIFKDPAQKPESPLVGV